MSNFKKPFEPCSIEIILFSANDIITTSGNLDIDENQGEWVGGKIGQ